MGDFADIDLTELPVLPPVEPASRCTGHCCRAFPLPLSPEEIRSHPGRYTDGDVISDMIVPVMAEGGVQRRNEFGNYIYTCRHLVDGNCAIYKNRPQMCRDYPYGGRCVNPGCTLDQSHLPPDLPLRWTDPEYRCRHTTNNSG